MSRQQEFIIRQIFPAWCDAEGEWESISSSEVEASDEAIRLRRTYPPCHVQVFARTVTSRDGIPSCSAPVLVGDLSSQRNWWRK